MGFPHSVGLFSQFLSARQVGGDELKFGACSLVRKEKSMDTGRDQMEDPMLLAAPFTTHCHSTMMETVKEYRLTPTQREGCSMPTFLTGDRAGMTK